MLKKSLFFLLALPILLLGSLDAYPQCSPELSSTLKTLYQFPETRAVIEKAESEGAIRIRWSPFQGSHSPALWNGEERVVVLNASKRQSDGEKISNILFELHNAIADSKFEHLDRLAVQGKISKNDYVQGVESIEHQNALQTSLLLEKGVRENVFPPDARWRVPATFEEHYRMQLQAGHSQVIAGIYDDLTARR